MKKRVALLLLIAIMLSIVLIPTEAEAKVYDGGYYDGLFWYIYADEYYRPASQGGGYTLHVSQFYAFGSVPDNLPYQSWAKYASDIVAVSIASDVSVIGYGTFANMPTLSKVSLPSSVLYIQGNAFANCPNLCSITLPRNLRGLGTHAFANTGITSAHIPTSVIEIGLNPFLGCNIRNIYYCGTAEQWNQIAFAGDSSSWANGVLSYHRWQNATCSKPQACWYCSKTEGTPKAHTWQDATCSQPKTCACGATEGEPLGHNYTEENSEVLQEATCSNTGRIKYSCTRCNHTHTETIEKLPHTYGEWKPQPYVSTGHLRQCTACGQGESGKCTYDEGVVTREPTCGDWGERTHTCTLCGGKQISLISPLPHGECKWVYNSSFNHRAVCTVCNQNTGEVADHTWDAGVITKEPTCIDFGEKTYTCTVCKGTKTETITTLAPHQYGSWTYLSSPQHYQECSVCGQRNLGFHKWNSGAVTKWPTCAEEGLRLHTCTVCNGTKESTINRLTEHTYDHPCDISCNVCGAIRTVPHSYSDTWAKNADKHYHECSICGEQKDCAAHVSGPAATETAPQNCTVCGYILAPILNHTHKYTSDWSINRNGHWHACVGCEDQQDYADHEFENNCDTDCSVCGYQRETQHNYGIEYQSGAEGHWFACTICGEKKDMSEHEPGPEATSDTAQNCTICGYEIAPPLPVTSEPSASPATSAPASSAAPDAAPSTDSADTSKDADDPAFHWPVLIIIPVVIGGSLAAWFIVKKKRK